MSYSHEKIFAMNKKAFIIIVSTIPLYLNAYIGPGMGGGVLLAIGGFILALIAALFGIIYYPIKRKILSYKNKKSDEK